MIDKDLPHRSPHRRRANDRDSRAVLPGPTCAPPTAGWRRSSTTACARSSSDWSSRSSPYPGPSSGIADWYRFDLCSADVGAAARHRRHHRRRRPPARRARRRRHGRDPRVARRPRDAASPTWYRRRPRAPHAAGARIVSICSGVFVLAAAGLLSGPACHDPLALQRPAGPPISRRRGLRGRPLRRRGRRGDVGRERRGARPLPPPGAAGLRRGGSQPGRPATGDPSPPRRRPGPVPARAGPTRGRRGPARRGPRLGPEPPRRAAVGGPPGAAREHERSHVRSPVPAGGRHQSGPLGPAPAGDRRPTAAGDDGRADRRRRRVGGPRLVHQPAPPLPGRARHDAVGLSQQVPAGRDDAAATRAAQLVGFELPAADVSPRPRRATTTTGIRAARSGPRRRPYDGRTTVPTSAPTSDRLPLRAPTAAARSSSACCSARSGSGS